MSEGGLIETADSALVDRLAGSPNHEPRRQNASPSILLLHYTGMISSAKAIDWLSRPESKVSCHYVVDENGVVTQMVAEKRRAWHAGVANWAGETDINSASIGIEIHNPGHELGYPEFPEEQMRAVVALAADIVRRNRIGPDRVLAHSDVAPSRKIDPGEKFDWRRLAAAGVGLWVEPEPPLPVIGQVSHRPEEQVVRHVQGLLARFGYGIDVTGEHDKSSRTVLAAFQRHFRPARVDGLIDHSSLVTLERLIAARPEALTA